MKRFKYKAKEKQTGKAVKGFIQAENEQTAGKLLIEQGYIPQSVMEEGAGLFGNKNRVTNKDRITFTRQLSTLIGAGLPLATSLRTVIEQTQGKGMKAIAEEILTDVESGKSLYDAFSKHSQVFNGVYLALIRALPSHYFGGNYCSACFYDDRRSSTGQKSLRGHGGRATWPYPRPS